MYNYKQEEAAIARKFFLRKISLPKRQRPFFKVTLLREIDAKNTL
jgi:hypothetical protein